MRVVLDTNIFLSGLISGAGAPARILDRWRAGDFTVVFTKELAAEYREVLLRPAFAALGSEQERLELLSAFLELENSHLVAAADRLALVARDPEDDRVLECALGGGAEVVVTGDEDLLALGEFRGIPILAPRAFLERLGG